MNSGCIAVISKRFQKNLFHCWICMRIFWTKHFGVWDVDATLVFDEIEIY